MTSLQNIAILGAQGHLMLMGSKFLQKTNICSLVIFTKTFDSINIRKPWVPEITMFCKEVIMIKTSTNVYQKLWPPISISAIKSFLGLGHSFLY